MKYSPFVYMENKTEKKYLVGLEIICIFAKNFDDYEETEGGQMVRRPETASAEAGEAAAVRAAVYVGWAVQDAVPRTEGVRPAVGRGALHADRDGAAAVGRVDDGRAAGVARRGVAGDGGAVLRGARAGLRRLERPGVLPDGDERRGFPPDVPNADGGRPDALHADDAGGGGQAERHRLAAEPQPVVPARVCHAARRAATAAAQEGGCGEVQIITRTPRQWSRRSVF